VTGQNTREFALVFNQASVGLQVRGFGGDCVDGGMDDHQLPINMNIDELKVWRRVRLEVRKGPCAGDTTVGSAHLLVAGSGGAWDERYCAPLAIDPLGKTTGLSAIAGVFATGTTGATEVSIDDVEIDVE
jgi:hypothetical protein